MQPSSEDRDLELETLKAERIAPDHQARKRGILGIMLGYAGFVGVLYGTAVADDQSLGFVLGMPLLALMVGWCFEDARQRNDIIGRFLRLGLILCFAAAFPIYAFKSRGLAGFATLIQALLFAVLLWLCFSTTNFVAARIFQ